MAIVRQAIEALTNPGKNQMQYLIAVLTIIAVSGSLDVNSAAGQSKSRPDKPGRSDETEFINPAIKKYGKVVKLPNAAHQPRAGSKIVVDLTKGGESDQLNPAVEKICRFVNIYAGAGKSSVKVKIAVVLHGDATLAVLNNETYAKRFDTKSNPNLECLTTLKKAGVKVYVCGQSLVGKGAKPSEVSPQAEVAVSALSALVNLQADGYSYLPMLK